MRTRTVSQRFSSITLTVAAALALLSAGCIFDESGVSVPDRIFSTFLDTNAPPTQITDQGGKVVIDVPGRLYVHHGYACGEARTRNFVRLEGSLRLPSPPANEPPFTHAAVYLNGWKVRFVNAEEEMVGFGAAIRNVKLVAGPSLEWEAGGGVTGEAEGDRIEFCYWRTAVAWTGHFQDLAVVEENLLNDPARRGGGLTGVLSSPRYVRDPSLEKPSWAGVLPMGFGLWWADLEEDYLLQAAYYMAPSDRFVYGGPRYRGVGYLPPPTLPPSTAPVPVDFANHGFVSWDSSAIFKNGNEADGFYLKDAATAIAGSQLDMIEPHFGMAPTLQVEIGQYGPTSRKITVENLDFHVGLPVLKGWNIFNHLDDEQVHELGMWIDDIQWTRSGGKGRLEYTVDYVISSNESVGHTGDPAVAILGIDDVFPD